jgi:hypothetical protein
MVANPSAPRNEPVAEPCTAETEQSVRGLVRLLGGPSELARHLGVKREVVCMWYAPSSKRPTKIPERHHAALWRLAQAKGVAWTPPGFEGLRLVPVVDPHSDDASVTSAQVVRENPVKLDDAA